MTADHVQAARGPSKPRRAAPGTGQLVVEGVLAGALLVVIVVAVGSALLWALVRGLLLLVP